MVNIAELPVNPQGEVRGYRLINSKFPPITLFDDVANSDEFEALYEIQTLTNPRIQNEIGNLNLIDLEEIPFGIPGCNYATAPFTHVNPEGSRFSDGSFGMLYLGQNKETALAEVKYHQVLYWSQVPDLKFERFVFRGLFCVFDEEGTIDATNIPSANPIGAEGDYSASRVLGSELIAQGLPGIKYNSVRSPGHLCWGLTTPRNVNSIVQSEHFEMIWNSGLVSVSELSE